MPVFAARTRQGSGLLAASVAAATLLLAPLPSAHAADVDSIAGSPAVDGAQDADRVRFDYQAAPGQRLDDAYRVKNTGTTLQTMTVLATDAFTAENGAYGLLDTDEADIDAGTWVTFEGGAPSVSLSLAPGEERVLPFSVAVPADARPGDHAAGIVTSVQSASDQILVDKRVATRLYVRVPGELQPALTVTSISSEYEYSLNPFGGTTHTEVTLTNSGNVALGADIVARTATWFGIPASGDVRQELPEMLPGSTRTITVDVPGVAQLGFLDARVSLQPTVEADALDPGPLPQVERGTAILVMPWFALALLLVGGGAALLLRWRRRRDDAAAREWMEFTEREARERAERELADAIPGDRS